MQQAESWIAHMTISVSSHHHRGQLSQGLSARARLNLSRYESLGRLESKVIAIIGWQLWTPLSTLQACLETLKTGWNFSSVAKKISILDIALQETRGLGELVRECLALFAASEQSDGIDESDLQSACPLNPSFELLKVAVHSEQVVASCRTGDSRSSKEIDWQNSLADFQLSEPIVIPDPALPVEEQQEAFEQVRSKLLAIVGHELRTPLCSLQVSLETLNEDAHLLCETDRQAFLEVAESDLNRLNRLIQSFFTLSRLERGLVTSNLERVDLRETLELAQIGFSARHQQRVLPTITLDCSEQVPDLLADEDKLVFTLMQLLENAYQFSGANGRIVISARCGASGCGASGWGNDWACSSQDRMVEIVVSDTGCGIEAECLEKVFDCFYQEADYLRRTVGGAGVGLTICKKLIESMGGNISANSLGKNQGSRICLMVPAYVA